jgi:methylthioribose-1-phosphate isomerase
MEVNNKHYRTIWLKEDDFETLQIIDQRSLPHEFIIEDLKTVNDIAIAIKDMHVRGAGLIGATAAYGMYIASINAPTQTVDHFNRYLQIMGDKLKATRPTAVNLNWAIDKVLDEVSKAKTIQAKTITAYETAKKIANDDAKFCKSIGEHGLKLIEEIAKEKNGEVVNILTHCNAGWLAFVDYGSATSPIYAAHKKGIKIHVWVDETRPRNQGARLTAWELNKQGIPHTIISDNVGGHIMQNKMVDLVIVGTDRTTYTGDVANKIGTYLKALAAYDNNIPFYVALPSSSFDWKIENGVNDIPIEERDGEEVKFIQGFHDGEIKKVLLTPQSSEAINFAFDVTPRKYITGLITERGICKAEKTSILAMFPEKGKVINQNINISKNLAINTHIEDSEQEPIGNMILDAVEEVETKEKIIDSNYDSADSDDGYIKFECEWLEKNSVNVSDIISINDWRNKMYKLSLIGAYDNGIGYGNISRKIGNYSESFLISGTKTGQLEALNENHYTIVNNVNLPKNFVKCSGPIKASSESMTHGAIYNASESTKAIIHI